MSQILYQPCFFSIKKLILLE